MDATFLNDLLECSVCLEQLDSTSKVLPCQHTFCKQCLEEIVSSHKELRCPECRVLVETKIDDLPCNILLIRLLDGIKNNARIPKPEVKRETTTSHHKQATSSSSSPQSVNVVHSPPQSVPQYIPRQRISVQAEPGKVSAVSKHYSHSLPCAKALYPYEAKEPGDLAFKKGDIILLRKRIDQNWYHGELNSKCGFLPASYVQVLAPISHPIPQCKALYDFSVSRNDEQDCLTFSKGDILTVIRRIDENWAEGKLGEKVGIFPVSFAQMNSAARTIMKLSANTFSGPSRTAPPTPNDSGPPQEQTIGAAVVEGTNAVINNTSESITTTSKTVTSKCSIPPGTFSEQGTSSSMCSLIPSTSSSTTETVSIVSVSAFASERTSDPAVAVQALIPCHSISHTTPTPSVRNSSSSLSSCSSSSTSSSSAAQALSCGATPFASQQTHHPQNTREKRHSLAITANQRSQIVQGTSSHRHSMEVLNALDCCNVTTSESASTSSSSSSLTPTSLNTATTAAPPLVNVSARVNATHSPLQVFQTSEPITTAIAIGNNRGNRRSSNCKDKEPFPSGVPMSAIISGNASMGSMKSEPTPCSSNSLNTSTATTTCQSPSLLTTNCQHQNSQSETPTYYVALYNYKPQKEDELELKKAELYTVSEKCQDGWFKGTAIHSAKSGVFPGNYVHVAKSSIIQAQFSQPSGVANVRSMTGKNPFAVSSSTLNPAMPSHSRQRSLSSSIKLQTNVADSLESSSTTNNNSNNIGADPATKLPSGAMQSVKVAVSEMSGPSIALTSTPLEWVSLDNVVPMKTDKSQESNLEVQSVTKVSSWPIKPWPGESLSYANDLSNSKCEDTKSSSSAAPKNEPSQTHSAISASGAVSTVVTPASNAQRSLDIFPSSSLTHSQVWLGPNSLYSSLVLSTAASAVTPPNVSVGMSHSIKNSLPSGSQLVSRSERKEKKEKEKVSLMKRLTSKRKSRSPPPSNYCDNPSFVDNIPHYGGPPKPSIIHTRSGSCPSEAFGSQNTVHKKTSSLDGSSNETPKLSYKSKQPPPLVRERFRCIVPYPPNSEFELELKVGDMVYVHKKRDDGWYKGTLQRTGKTGLFPASFVDSCN